MRTVTRESWTDERLDEFGKRMDERFDRVDERIKNLDTQVKQGFAQVDRRFEVVDKRFEHVDMRLDRLADGIESIQRALIFGAIAMSSAIIAGFGALVTQV